MNVPNALTVSRIVLLPVALWLHALQKSEWCVGLLIFCFLTDFLDGKLARKLGQVTALGALLDPVADKWVVLVSYGYLFHLGLVPWWYALLLYARNICQLAAIPVLVWWLKRSFHVRPKWPAKWATTVAFVLIPLFLLTDGVALPTEGVFLELVRFYGMLALMVGSALLEFQVLLTYVPRFFQIARETHDTFE